MAGLSRHKYEQSLKLAHMGRQDAQSAQGPRLREIQPRMNLGQAGHPLAKIAENARLNDYEASVKERFDMIVPVLKQVSAMQHEADFCERAQRMAREQFGFELPEHALADAWVEQLDMRSLFAWSVFETYKRYCDEFIAQDPLRVADDERFDDFLQACGFHIMDISPCSDGRLAHVIRYVLRLPHRSVRRKSYAGAMFDVEDSIQKWVETELGRFREGQPNKSDEPTRYLKVVAYHYSSVDPANQGCAAHGSDDAKAARAALDKLESFQQAIENSFCCGASIDLLLMGVDTDTDAIRVHVPDSRGKIALERFVDAKELYRQTQSLSVTMAREEIRSAIKNCCADVSPGMLDLVTYLMINNLSQIDYVRQYHGQHYADIGHAERFIGAGVGFEEIQLRNLMYFAYMQTVEEGAPDLDVGVKIFTGLNVSHGLPVPVVVRYDYHGQVPGSRERSIAHCRRVEDALKSRYRDLFDRGLMHTLLVVRDCDESKPLEMVGCSAMQVSTGSGH